MSVLFSRHAEHSGVYHSTCAIILWFTIASILAIPLILRVCRLLGLSSLARKKYSPVNRVETDPSPVLAARRLSERLADLTSALLALQFHSRLRLSHAVLIPVARAVVLFLYAGFLVLLFLLQLAVDGKITLERAGFRLAWLAIAHLPLVLLLSLRFNVVAFAFGISPERLNWCHRWAATIFIVLSFLHGLLFTIEWVTNNFFWLALKVMPSVLHGMIAVAIQIWIGFSSFAPISRLSYEVFKFQHLVFPPILLYFLWVHTHNGSRLVTVFSVYLLLLDSVSRCAVLLYRNVRVLRGPAYNRLGFPANLEALGPDITMITVDGVDFEWAAG